MRPKHDDALHVGRDIVDLWQASDQYDVEQYRCTERNRHAERHAAGAHPADSTSQPSDFHFLSFH